MRRKRRCQHHRGWLHISILWDTAWPTRTRYSVEKRWYQRSSNHRSRGCVFEALYGHDLHGSKTVYTDNPILLSGFVVPANKLGEYGTIESAVLSSAHLFLCWSPAMMFMSYGRRCKAKGHTPFPSNAWPGFTSIRWQTTQCSLDQSEGLVSQLWRIRKCGDVFHLKRHKLDPKKARHGSYLCYLCILSREARPISWQILSCPSLEGLIDLGSRMQETCRL